MHKARKRSTLHHLKRAQKLQRWTKLARQVIKGEITLPQMERIAGPSSRGVLRTAAYLATREALIPPALVAQAISTAMAPALASSNLPKPTIPAPRVAAIVAAAPAATPTAAAAEPAARPRTRAAARARTAAPKEAAPATEDAAEAKSAPRRAATRRATPAATEAPATSAKEVKPAAPRRATTRRRTTGDEKPSE